MPDQPIIIQPVKPPLSHLGESRRQSINLNRAAWIGFATVLSIGALVWVFSFEAPKVQLVQPAPAEANRPAAEVNRQKGAPFADLEHQRQLESARERLGELVEIQTALKESMQVGLWGEQDYQAAMDRATEADLAFQEKRYEDAWAGYGDATARFKALMEKGESLFTAHLETGAKALDSRDAAGAEREFAAALIIKAENQSAQAGLDRAKKLPLVSEALRKAANHELAGRWTEALAAYDEAMKIDPQTTGVAELRARVGGATTQEQIRKHLSDGFAAVDSRQLERARTAFNRVLALDPDNPVAAGALQQVSAQGDVDRIRAGEDRGMEAEAREDWSGAIKAYEAVLAIDGAIEFAKSGLSRAKAHARALELLDKIRKAPEKLSSPTLFQEAQSILAEARTLSPAGPRLTEHISAVDQLVRTYSEPVNVTLTSDGATAVILSTVGPLGTFASKTVSLRPGEYTVVGSQKGCRDIRETIVVKPDMQPVSVRCTERVN
jgi:tetratricopeptide (TPR) repeat protein